ncbi:MAG: CpXC domain-containing protein [Elusimicrobiota bacterium]
MSIENYRIVKCPHCLTEFEAKFYSVVRGDIDLDLKDLIINGEFNLLICPNCGKMFTYEDNFIYLDPKARLFVFVMPEYYETQEEIVKKLKTDYQSLEGEISTQKGLKGIEPIYFFGIDKLSQLLINERDIEEESEVIEAIAKEKNLKTRKIKRNFARENGLPFVMPYLKSLHKGDVVEVLTEILKENKTLKRIKRLIEVLEDIEEEEIDFIDED